MPLYRKSIAPDLLERDPAVFIVANTTIEGARFFCDGFSANDRTASKFRSSFPRSTSNFLDTTTWFRNFTGNLEPRGMNQHAGPASAMSVLIIGLFAILLHDRPPHPPALKPPQPSNATRPATGTPRTVQQPSPVPARATGEVALNLDETPVRPKPSTPIVTRPQRVVPAPTTPIKERARAIATPAPAPRPALVPSPQPIVPNAPFTVVKAGEKLSDVASRIYGTAAAAESLWRANRDQVASLDSNLAGGTLLRTP